VFTREIEQALLDGRIDVAVHSAKDLTGDMPAGLEIAAVPEREDPRDACCGPYGSLAEVPAGARIGTSSARRAGLLGVLRPDLEVVPLRGNVDTRLAKLAGEGGLDAIVLARAGLQRLGREGDAGALLDAARFVPAPGQGALALEGRADDESARRAAQGLTDAPTMTSLLAERALARELGADCHTALGAHARLGDGGRVSMRAWVGLPDGSAWASDELEGAADRPEVLGSEVAARLRAVGAEELLAGAREMASDAG
jgi:hydroxymethylbilane synthase